MGLVLEQIDGDVAGEVAREIVPEDRMLDIGRETRQQSVLDERGKDLCVGVLLVDPICDDAVDGADGQEDVVGDAVLGRHAWHGSDITFVKFLSILHSALSLWLIFIA